MTKTANIRATRVRQTGPTFEPFLDKREVGRRLRAASLGEERLADYEPETHWERQPVTDKQAELLARAGFDLTRITCKGHASKWIDLLFRRRDLGLATPKQVRWLVHFGHPNPHLATFEEAGAYLDGKFTGRRRRSLVPTR